MMLLRVYLQYILKTEGKAGKSRGTSKQKSRKAGKSRKEEKQKGKETEKQKSRKSKKQRSKEAEKHRSKETEKWERQKSSKAREAGQQGKVEKQRSRESQKNWKAEKLGIRNQKKQNGAKKWPSVLKYVRNVSPYFTVTHPAAMTFAFWWVAFSTRKKSRFFVALMVNACFACLTVIVLVLKLSIWDTICSNTELLNLFESLILKLSSKVFDQWKNRKVKHPVQARAGSVLRST